MGLLPKFPGNPRQGWQFQVLVNGFEAAVFQKATIPEVEIEIDEFSSGGSVRSEKFAGRAKIGDCTLEKGMFADRMDRIAWDWLTTAVNTKTGNQGAPVNYKRDVEIRHVNRVGVPIQTWLLKGAFCSKISWSDNEGDTSEHMVETLTLTVEDVEVL